MRSPPALDQISLDQDREKPVSGGKLRLDYIKFEQKYLLLTMEKTIRLGVRFNYFTLD